MVSNPIFSPLLLLALVWLGFVLYMLWPYGRPATCLTILTPTPPPRKRSNAPNPLRSIYRGL